MNARLSAKWLSAALLVCPLAARAQITDSDHFRGSFSGRVLFEEDNRAAEGVKVTLSLSTGQLIATVFAGANGLFEVPGLSSAIYVIVIEEPGYEPIREAVQMDISARPSVLLYLKKANSPLSSQPGYVVSVRELSIPPKARKAFQKGIERWAKRDPAGTLAHFQRAVAELPSYYEAYYQMGLVYTRLGRAAEAEEAFQKAIDLSQSRYPLALFGLASLLSENNRFSEAEPLARRGLEVDGNSWYGQFELARALMGLNQVDAAEKSAREARTRKRDFPPLHLVLANIHIRKGNYPALLEDLDTYLKLEPKSPASEQARQMREKVRRALTNAPNAPPAQPPKP
jgi:tetratricopeptide (TPR) repeat protein